MNLWWLFLCLKLALATVVPLAGDEAYYWVWSQHRQLGYFDHPAMIAYWISLSNFLPLELVRWPNVILGHLASLFLWKSFAPELPEGTHSKWALLFFSLPLTGWGSIVLTPDAPLIFFWAGAIYLYRSILFNREPEKNWGKVILLGIFLGLGFNSKYHMVLIVPLFFADLFLNHRGLQTLPLRQWCLLLATGLVSASPVLVWNFQNDWASFRFQLDHGFGGSSKYDPIDTISYLVGQGLLVGIATLVPLLRFVFRRPTHFLSLSFMIPIVFFLVSSFRASVEANWPLMAHLAVPFLLLHQQLRTGLIVLQAGIYTALVFLAAACFLLPNLAKHAPEKGREIHQIKSVLPHLTPEQTPLFAGHYQFASLLSFYSGKQICKLEGMSRFDFFDTLDCSKVGGLQEFYLVRLKDQPLPTWATSNWKTEQVLVTDWGVELLRVFR